jgi:heme O synthase-like polyprenyltransferase
LFFIATMLFPLLSYSGIFYGITVGLSSLLWTLLIAKGFWSTQDDVWARQVFLSSIAVVTIFSLAHVA